MDGVVLRRDGEIGEIAEVGQILFRVGVPKPLQVVAEVNEEDIPRVALGPEGAVPHRCVSDRQLEGTVSEITPMGEWSPRPTASRWRCPMTRRSSPA